MTCDRVSFAARLRMRPLDYVHFGPVMLKKIEVDRSKVPERITKIARYGNGLQKYFRHHDRRSEIHIDAAVMQVP